MRIYNSSIFTYFLMIVTYSPYIEALKYGLESITATAYEEQILDNVKDAYILAVKDVGNMSIEDWMEVEIRLRGLYVKVGIIDPRKDGAYLKRKGFLRTNNSYPLARVFPYGGRKIKQAGSRDFWYLNDAKKTALRSIPDETTKIKVLKEVENFVHSAYGTSPPRFPVILFTDKLMTSPLYKALSLKYSTYFNFGVTRKPSKDFFQQFRLNSLPSLVVMASTIHPDKQLTFSSIPFDVRSYGEMNYLNIAKFLYSVHEKHWKSLPNIDRFKGKMLLNDEYIQDTKAILSLDANDEESYKSKQIIIQEITSKNHKYICGDKTRGLCLILFIDGQDESMKTATFKFVYDVIKLLQDEGIPIQYLWIDSTCHPSYGDVFGIFPETLPSILLVKPRKQLFAKQNLKGTTAIEIKKMVSIAIKDDKALQRYARFNDMETVHCKKREVKKAKTRKEL